MRYILYYLKKFWFISILVIMILLFVAYAKRNNLLNVYTDGNSEYTMIETDETKTEVQMQDYASEQLDFTMQVPDGWDKVTKDGYDTFIHAPSATSIQIQVLSYYPQINNVSADSIYEDMMARGYSLTNFTKNTVNSYLATYQSETSAGVMDYIDYVIWDLSSVIKINVTVQDQYYGRMEELILNTLDSLVWNYESPIPAGISVYYFLSGDFQFGIPTDWMIGEQKDSLYAYDEAGASMSVSLLENQDADVDSITQLDYANFVATGKNNFILSRFEKGGNYIYAEANYSVNNTMMGMMQYYAIYGRTHYIITFEIPYDYISTYYNLCYGCIQIFRTFGTQTDEARAEQEEQQGTEDLGMFDISINDLLDDVPISTTPQANQPTQTEVAQTKRAAGAQNESSDPNNITEVSSFADALVQTANIPTEKALEISQIWASLQAGTPTYARAIKESKTSYIVYITVENNTAYYMTLNKDGTLEKICMNSEDGAIIYRQE